MTTPDPDAEAPRPLTAGTLAVATEPARPFTPCQHVFERFFLDRRLLAIPVVEDDRPVALIGRGRFLEAYRHGPCGDESGLPHRVERHLGDPPRTFDEATPLDDLAERFVADAGGELADGLLVTREGRYLGVVAPHALVRALAERGHAAGAVATFRDESTGLASASLFEDRLVMAVAAADRSRNRVAALVLDLRTSVEEGEEPSGPELVRTAAERIEPLLRRGDTVARLGHARLGIALPGIGHVEGARQVGRKVLEALAMPPGADGTGPAMAATLGIALFPDDAASAKRLMQCAVRAAEQAAEAGSDPAGASSGGAADPVCYGTLRDAIEHHQLALVYQPQVDLATGRTCGVEALVRWTQAGGRAVSPSRIIALAESSGLMEPLTEWVLRTACAQMRSWHASRVLVVRLAVNVSGAQARQPELPALVERVLRDTGVPPASLEIELTEHEMSAQGPALLPVLARLRELGVRVAVDDFGSGALPIRQLAGLPIDAVKLDGSVIAGVASDPRAESLARSVLALARELGLQVIAEGVETADQARVLQAHGCDVAQGFHFSPPLTPDAVPGFVRREPRG